MSSTSESPNSISDVSMKAELEAKCSWYAEHVSPLFSETEQRVNDDFSTGLATAGKHAKKVGDKAPNFDLPDYISDARVSLSGLLSKGPLVLFFYRGSWCPWCNIQVKHFQRSLQAFQSALKDQSEQVQVAGITLQAKEHVEKMKNDAGVTYPLLTDGAGGITADYGLLYHVPAASAALWKEKFGLDLVALQQNPKIGDVSAEKADTINGDKPAVVDGVELVLPIPGVFIIDTKGIIRYADVRTNYRTRADIQEIVQALTAL